MISSRFVSAALVFIASTSLAWIVPTAPQRRAGALPSGFRAVGPAPADEVINLRFALPQKDFSGLEKALYAASTPGGENYGQYLSKAEVNAFVAPSTEILESVRSWLTTNGLSSSLASPAGDWITVNATVEQANKLLQAKYTSFSQDGTDTKVTRTLEFTIPAEVKDSILTIHPTVTFPVISSSESRKPSNLTASANPVSDRRNASQSTAADDLPASCISDPNDDSNENFEKPYSAACRFDLYGIPKTLATQKSNNLWVTGVNNEFANKALIKEYLQNNRPEVANSTTFNLVTIDGGLNNQLPGGASIFATGAMWVVTSTAAGVPLTFMSVGTDTSDDALIWYLDQANYLLNMEDPPKVLLTSGWALWESTTDPVLASQICNAFAQLAARGVSIIHADASGGVQGGSPDGSCKFDVSFPSSCPYVTTVGASTVESGEELPNSGFGANSGGFSNLFERPSYQDAAVSSYLNYLGGAYEGLYNASGRASKSGVHSTHTLTLINCTSARASYLSTRHFCLPAYSN
jgi:tripeptidyl-peptidase-1